jgi:hypothetical protein
MQKAECRMQNEMHLHPALFQILHSDFGELSRAAFIILH